MRTLINYIRSCFCKHDWEEMSHTKMYDCDPFTKDLPIGDRWTYRCKKVWMF